jgi:hypothetical protein
MSVIRHFMTSFNSLKIVIVCLSNKRALHFECPQWCNVTATVSLLLLLIVWDFVAHIWFMLDFNLLNAHNSIGLYCFLVNENTSLSLFLLMVFFVAYGCLFVKTMIEDRCFKITHRCITVMMIVVAIFIILKDTLSPRRWTFLMAGYVCTLRFLHAMYFWRWSVHSSILAR